MKIDTKVVEVEKVVTTTVKEKMITLELTQEEAFYLKAMAGNIIGGGKARDFTSQIYWGLERMIPKNTGNVFSGTLSVNKEFVYE